MAQLPTHVGVNSSDEIRRTFAKLLRDFTGHTHDAADIVSGEIDVARGGTNIASYAVGDVLYASGATTLAKLPIGTAGYVLTAGATIPSWAVIPTQTSALLSATHTDTTAAAVVRGDIITGQGASPTWTRLAKGTQYQVLTGGASEPAWSTVALNQATAISGTLPVGNGGTGQTTAQLAMNALAGAVTSTYYLRGNGTNVVMAALQAADITGTVPVGNGGTGAATATNNYLFAGPATAPAAAPSFRALVTADLGTTLEPRFSKIGLAIAVDASALLTSSGNQRFNSTGSNIYTLPASSASASALGLAAGAITTNSNGASILLSSTSVDDGADGTIYMYTNQAGVGAGERVQITPAGLVGLGMTPTYKLDVNGQVRVVGAAGTAGTDTSAFADTWVDTGLRFTYGGQTYLIGAYIREADFTGDATAVFHARRIT